MTPELKRWFITVDWCHKENRGIFCNIGGGAFSQETQHTEDAMWEILGPFDLILNPQSLALSEDELKEYNRFIPLAEYSMQYGIALKSSKLMEVTA